MKKWLVVCLAWFAMFQAPDIVCAEKTEMLWAKTGKNGLTLFELALAEKDFDKVRGFLLQGADPNFELFGGGNPLHRACSGNNPRLVTLLLDSGSDPNHRDNRGWLPIMWAVSSDDASQEIVRLLPEKSTDLRLPDLTSILNFHAPSHRLNNPAWRASYRKMRQKLTILENHLKQKGMK